MASISFIFFCLFTLFLIGSCADEKNCSQRINSGSSLSPITHNNSWPSSSGDFEFGFYRQGGGFAIGIWLVGSEETTVVWTANRDYPPLTVNATHVFTDKLLLITEQGQEILIANTTRTASFACMTDSGNFVLYDGDSDVIWESFEHPTDTILEGQILPVRGQLFSSISESDHSTGRFRLKMQDDGNLVLYPVNTEDTYIFASWATNVFGGGFKFHLYLSTTGLLSIINTTTSNSVHNLSGASTSAADNNQNSSTYRATLDADGIFRLYSHARDGNGKLRAPTRVWSALENPCAVKGFCGLDSYCTYYDAQPNCVCLPGTDFADPSSRTSGCLTNYTELGCRHGKENTSFYYITRMENMVWGGLPYTREEMTVEECSKSCLKDCNCGAALYKTGLCAKQKHPLIYVRRDIRE
ncbi:G-type lectin S-receptor-like serine/threonine-protein kinase [Morus notabilis]|uniref:G-type lectin S-receptor-like serine/threonine-protein kinase n=1 Tax=Morus notabilis TaxID=981085 RepID=W9R543_9ROSA|nr:G-type lectin S-receptor-like serine/threonine-protein kinase [Morus notabilis]